MRTLLDRTYFFALSLLTAAIPAGCDEPDGGFGGGADAAARCVGCGIVFNTNAVNGLFFSEVDLTGDLHDNVIYKGAEISHIPLTRIYAVDGELFGEVGETVYRGSRVVGMVIHIIAVIGKVEVKTDLTIVSADHSQGYWRYGVQYTDVAHNKEGVPTCEQDEFGDASMVFYADISVDTTSGDVRDRPKTLYFGCVSGAVGKARTTPWRYAPYDPQVKLEGFETAIRAIRADYCGDGVSYTKPGNKLQLRDQYGYHNFANQAMNTEAVWASGGGALCLDVPRWAGQVARADVHCAAALPSCLSDAADYYAIGSIWTKIAP